MLKHTLRHLSALTSLLAPMFLQACSDNTNPCETRTTAGGETVCKSVDIAESTLALSSDEPPGEHCAAGGQRIDTGFDDNGNGQLDSSEVIQSVYVCNGASGVNPRVEMIAEDPSATCPNGSIRLFVGMDTNGDGLLQDDEVTDIRDICQGQTGADGQGATGAIGPTGADGLNGSTGPTGASGADGAIGATGADGATGPTGAHGATGASGADGATGTIGATGADGATGATGADGATGATGADGATGATGSAGIGSFCDEVRSTNGIAIPILVVDTNMSMAGMFDTPLCTGSAISFSGSRYVFNESGVYLVLVSPTIQPPLALEDVTITATLDPLGTPVDVNSVTYTFNNSVLAPMNLPAQFVIQAQAGDEFQTRIQANLLGNIIVGGIFTNEKVGELLP
jgi:hypothetical protein